MTENKERNSLPGAIYYSIIINFHEIHDQGQIIHFIHYQPILYSHYELLSGKKSAAPVVGDLLLRLLSFDSYAGAVIWGSVHSFLKAHLLDLTCVTLGLTSSILHRVLGWLGLRKDDSFFSRYWGCFKTITPYKELTFSWSLISEVSTGDRLTCLICHWLPFPTQPIHYSGLGISTRSILSRDPLRLGLCLSLVLNQGSVCHE